MEIAVFVSWLIVVISAFVGAMKLRKACDFIERLKAALDDAREEIDLCDEGIEGMLAKIDALEAENGKLREENGILEKWALDSESKELELRAALKRFEAMPRVDGRLLEGHLCDAQIGLAKIQGLIFLAKNKDQAKS